MGDKFIPNGDQAFADMARGFAGVVANDPARCGVEPADSEALSAAVSRYREVLNAMRYPQPGQRPAAAREKDEARAAAEKIIRRLVHVIKASETAAPLVKSLLKLRERPARAKARACPQAPPRLRFVRALHESGATPMHELTFHPAGTWSKTKPAGAARVELFVDLVAPDGPIPARPGAGDGGRAWYLRSYTRNPIVLTPPMARVPMRVVYWARWADSTGNAGPFSATAVGWIEGGSQASLPGARRWNLFTEQPPPMEDVTPGESTYSVAVLEARDESMNGATIQSLRAPEEPRQLEGPPRSEAA